MHEVSVAIPVRDGGELFAGVLGALATQTVEHELLVCDSGSSDRSVALAREHGARVIEIPSERFSHGGTRNRLMQAASGARVALLTQDSQPADERWLERLLGGFQLGTDVAIVFGPYRPRADAGEAVRIELEAWFASLSPDGSPQVERLAEHERSLPAVELVGRRGFFSDANACVDRAAWERVPFRDVPYAEDRVLALDMLRAGYAKAFVADAPTFHSHRYTASQQLRRSFDEWRGLLEVYGWREPLAPARLLGGMRGELRRADSQLVERGAGRRQRARTLASVSRHHVVSRAGALLGSRADMLPAPLTRRLSLEGRAGFRALDDGHQPTHASDQDPYRR